MNKNLENQKKEIDRLQKEREQLKQAYKEDQEDLEV